MLWFKKKKKKKHRSLFRPDLATGQVRDCHKMPLSPVLWIRNYFFILQIWLSRKILSRSVPICHFEIKNLMNYLQNFLF
jgi:hypothetical protein